MTTYSGIMVITAIFQCRPMRAAWDVAIEAQCIKINLAWMIMAGLNVITDFILLIAPLPTLWKLQIPGEQKLQLMSVFCIGSLYVHLYSCIDYPSLSLDRSELTHDMRCPVSASSPSTVSRNSTASPLSMPHGLMRSRLSGPWSRSAWPLPALARLSTVL